MTPGRCVVFVAEPKGSTGKYSLFGEICSLQIIYSSTFSTHVSRCNFSEPGGFFKMLLHQELISLIRTRH